MDNNFEKFLANHCAPLLCGKKPAALLAKKTIPKGCDWRKLSQYGFRILRLNRKETHSLIFIYHPALLEKALSHPIAIRTLEEIGYSQEKELSGSLAFLRRRFSESNGFPHEIGFFLGYPPEDVIGFLSCKVRCKLRGQWKVYSDVGRATALFDEYKLCKQTLLNYIKNGTSIFTVLAPAYAG